MRILLRLSRPIVNSQRCSVVLSEDAHQNEDVAEADKRRQWFSGFTGAQALPIAPHVYLIYTGSLHE